MYVYANVCFRICYNCKELSHVFMNSVLQLLFVFSKEVDLFRSSVSESLSTNGVSTICVQRDSHGFDPVIRLAWILFRDSGHPAILSAWI